MTDVEEGELEDFPAPSLAQEEIASVGKLKVPDAPDSPKRASEDALAGGHKKKLKKQVVKAVAAGQKVNRDVFRAIYGAEAKAKVVLSQQMKGIRPSDVQALVLWVLADRTEGRNPTWAFVQNVPLIKQVVLLFVPAISASLFSTRQDLMPSLAKIGPAITMHAKDGLTRPAYSISILLKVPFSKEKQKLLNQAAAELERPNAAAEAKEMPFPCSYYVLKPDMMEKLGYPLLCKQEDGTLQLPEGFVIYDALVRPKNPITNYHTDKSGITEELLEHVTTRLQDVQAKFVELVPAEAILVGHALENDLKALRVVHMKCIDTGALFPHPKGLPFRSALRRLAERFLKRQIQQGQHDSVIDASTALDLALLKMRHGPAFGLSTSKDFGEPLPEVLLRASKGCILVDRPDTLHRFLSGAADGITCTNDEEIAQKLCKEAKKEISAQHTARLVWGQLREISDFYEARVGEQRKQAAAERARAELKEPETGQLNGKEHGGPSEAGFTGDTSKSVALTGSKRRRGSGESLEEGSINPSKRQHTASTADVSGADPRPPSPSDSEQMSLDGKGAAVQKIGTLVQREEGEQEDTPEEAIIRETDARVGRIYESLPRDTLFVVCSCQGDTAKSRYAQEKKMKRSQGIEAPPWSQQEEKAFIRDFMNVSSQGVCFVTVK